MIAAVFIGDEVTAAGYRLAGARVVVSEPGQAADALAGALASAELVLLTAACAAGIPRRQLDRVMRDAHPPLIVVPDAAGLDEPEDLVAAVDRALDIDR